MATKTLPFKFLSFIILIFSSFSVLAQTKVMNYSRIDSIEFYATRKKMEVLPVADFSSGIYNHSDGVLPYRLLLPSARKKRKKYPLVITLHNSSRIGTDNQGQLENLAKIWLRPEIRESYPCLVLAPQFSERSSSYAMSDQGYLVSSPSKDVAVLSELIDQILKQHPEADRDRVYLIGYSMGGSTVQNLLRYCGDKVAAIISIAAVPDLAVIADLKKMPVWLIHGKKDIENPFVGSEKLFGLLTGNKQLRFTEFTSLDHGNILIPLLLDDRLPNWLFSQRK